MFARLHSSKLFYPTLAIGSAIALYSAQQQYSLFSTIRNETSSAVFKGDGAWVDLKISKIEQVSADTKKFTFQFPESSDVSGLVTASAVLAKYVTPKGSNVIRPYTPTSDIGTKGEIDFVIKHYAKGKFTTHLFGLNVNDTVSFKGPILKWRWEPNSFDEITLIGAGTGITPLYQLAHHIAQNPEDHTKIKLFYGNKTPSDILLKSELDALAAKYPNKFHVEYFVDNTDGAAAADATKLNKGFITKNDLSAKAAKSTEKTHVFVCGPPPFMNAYSGPKVSPSDQGDLTGILSELGFTKDQVFKF